MYKPLLFVYSVIKPLKIFVGLPCQLLCHHLQDCTAVVVYTTVKYVYICIYLYYSCIQQYTRLYAQTSHKSPKFGDVSYCTSAFIMYTCTDINTVYFGSLYLPQVGLEMSLLGLHLSSDITDLTFFFSFSHTFPLIILLLGR